MLMSPRTPAQVALLSVYAIVFTILAMISFSTGLKLWMVKPGAVRFAKQFLIINLCAHSGYFAFWVILRRPVHSASLAEMGWDHVVGILPFTLLWYFYLENSRRVRQTYEIQ